jgi:methylglutaconyl-CoA hydratase
MVLKKKISKCRATLTINRPEIHNALNDELIDALDNAIAEMSADDSVRMIVLAGEGKSFCAGADLKWMKAVVNASVEENKADAGRLVNLLNRMILCPKPIVARVHGAVYGGGMGILAACDLVAAVPKASFGLTEVRLGLVPAMIFPFLLRKTAPQRLLRAAITGERFRADQAALMGLVDEVAEDLDSTIDGWQRAFLSSGPESLGRVKELFNEVPKRSFAEAQQFALDMIAEARASDEGQEGMKAFLERRQASWRSDEQ